MIFRMVVVEINDKQPLHKVIFQLQRAGYCQLGVPMENVSVVRTCKIPESQANYYEFLAWHINAVDESYQRVTLEQLKKLNKGEWI